MNPLTHLDLFSGIGGFALACRWAGIETVQFVEIDPFCQKILAKNFSGVPIHEDIKTFKWTEASPFLITGGFPCQPFSCAGKRRGKEDDRFLWPEMLRVISEARPTWVIGENVAGFINLGLDDCISDLESEGYEVQVFVIPACAVNAPHRRDRVWILGRRTDVNDTESRGCGFLHTENIGEAAGEINTSSVSDCHAPDTASKRCEDSGRMLTGLYQQAQGDGERESFRDNGRPRWRENWLEVATRLCRVDDGLPRQMDRVNRLKALGNAIVPQVAYQIIKAIVTIESDRA